MAIDWVQYLSNLVPAHAKGIVAVLKSCCGGHGYDGVTVSYQIRGLHAAPLGLGDHHDPRYDDMVVSAPFVQLQSPQEQQQSPTTTNTTTTTLLPPDVDITCLPQLDLYLYPSRELQDSFSTNQALVYTLVVVSLFGATALVLALYDATVRRRQGTIRTRLQQQERIVSNLLPTELRRCVLPSLRRRQRQEQEPPPNSSDATLDHRSQLGDAANNPINDDHDVEEFHSLQSESPHGDDDDDEEYLEDCLRLTPPPHERLVYNEEDGLPHSNYQALANRFFQTTVIHAVRAFGSNATTTTTRKTSVSPLTNMYCILCICCCSCSYRIL